MLEKNATRAAADSKTLFFYNVINKKKALNL